MQIDITDTFNANEDCDEKDVKYKITKKIQILQSIAIEN